MRCSQVTRFILIHKFYFLVRFILNFGSLSHFIFCFLGNPPFVSESMTGLVDLILNEDPPPLRRKGFTPQLKDIVLFLSVPFFVNI